MKGSDDANGPKITLKVIEGQPIRYRVIDESSRICLAAVLFPEREKPLIPIVAEEQHIFPGVMLEWVVRLDDLIAARSEVISSG